MSYSVENPAHSSPHVTQELEKFLKPVVVLMKVLGFNLSYLPEHVPHRLQSRLVKLLGWIFLITNLINCVTILYILSIKFQVKGRSSTILWTLKITFFNDMMFKLLNHLSLLITVSDTSTQLQLSKILQKLSFPGLKIRQLSVPVIIIFLTVKLSINLQFLLFIVRRVNILFFNIGLLIYFHVWMLHDFKRP